MVRLSKRPGPDREPIEIVLLNPDGTPLGSGSTSDEPAPDLGRAIRAGVRHLGRTTAAPGHRAGGTSDRITRQGCDEEVVTPILVSPDLAAAAMSDGGFFRPFDNGLSVDSGSLQVDRTGLRWRARLRTGAFSSRAANLRLYSSPSHNVAVLELIPDAKRLIRTRSFVRRGVPAIAELADEIGRLKPMARGWSY